MGRKKDGNGVSNENLEKGESVGENNKNKYRTESASRGWFNVAQIAAIKNPIKEAGGHSVKDLNEKMVGIRIVSGR